MTSLGPRCAAEDGSSADARRAGVWRELRPARTVTVAATGTLCRYRDAGTVMLMARATAMSYLIIAGIDARFHAVSCAEASPLAPGGAGRTKDGHPQTGPSTVAVDPEGPAPGRRRPAAPGGGGLYGG